MDESAPPVDPGLAADHPFRQLKKLVESLLVSLEKDISVVPAGQAISIPARRVLLGSLIQVLYETSNPGELCNQLSVNPAFRWFLDFGPDEPTFRAHHYRQLQVSLLSEEVASKFIREVARRMSTGEIGAGDKMIERWKELARPDDEVDAGLPAGAEPWTPGEAEPARPPPPARKPGERDPGTKSYKRLADLGENEWEDDDEEDAGPGDDELSPAALRKKAKGAPVDDIGEDLARSIGGVSPTALRLGGSMAVGKPKVGLRQRIANSFAAFLRILRTPGAIKVLWKRFIHFLRTRLNRRVVAGGLLTFLVVYGLFIFLTRKPSETYTFQTEDPKLSVKVYRSWGNKGVVDVRVCAAGSLPVQAAQLVEANLKTKLPREDQKRFFFVEGGRQAVRRGNWDYWSCHTLLFEPPEGLEVKGVPYRIDVEVTYALKNYFGGPPFEEHSPVGVLEISDRELLSLAAYEFPLE